MLPAVTEPTIPFAPPHYICRRSKQPYLGRIDGRLDKAFWNQAAEISDFRDIEGDGKPRPHKETGVRLLWDDTSLYIGAILHDDEIWASVSGRDEIVFTDNDFEVFLSPKHSTHRYYELEINAMNTVWDLLMEKPHRDLVHRISAWDIAGIKHAVHIDGRLNDPGADNRYWSVELMIPWSPLREAEPDQIQPAHLIPDVGEVWRMNFSRVEYLVDVADNRYRKRANAITGQPLPEYNWVWAPTGAIDTHMPELWGYLVFGDESTQFNPPADEDVAWNLRKLFYRQRNFGAVYGYYTTDFNDLRGSDKWCGIPSIYATPSLFEIILPSSSGALHIRQDGYLWED